MKLLLAMETWPTTCFALLVEAGPSATPTTAARLSLFVCVCVAESFIICMTCVAPSAGAVCHNTNCQQLGEFQSPDITALCD